VALSRRERLVWSAVAVHAIALLFLAVTSAPSQQPMGLQVDVPTFHGGSPGDAIYGSCFQGDDGYTMCNPFLSVGVLLVPDPPTSPPQVLLSHRAGEGVSILQQHVRAGETAESALRKLIKEGIGLDIQSLPGGQGPSLFGMYSKPPPEGAIAPRRRRHRHIARAIYVLRILPTSPDKPCADLVKVPLSNISGQDPLLTKISDDDRIVLEDYLSNAAAESSWEDSASSRRSAHHKEIGPDIVRSVC